MSDRRETLSDRIGLACTRSHWVHFHRTNLAEISSAASSLRTHLAIFHSAIDLTSDDDLGWHCHWVMPVWGHAVDDTPDDELPSQEVFAFDSATAFPRCHWHLPVRRLVVGLLQFPSLPSPKFVEGSFRRQGEILDPISRRDLFSVLRC